MRLALTLTLALAGCAGELTPPEVCAELARADCACPNRPVSCEVDWACENVWDVRPTWPECRDSIAGSCSLHAPACAGVLGYKGTGPHGARWKGWAGGR